MELISRQQAVDALNEYFARIGKLKRRGLTKGEKAISLDTVGTINSLPPAEPKRGRWIEDKGQQTLMQCFIAKGEVWRVCSECGAGHMIGHKYECDKAYHEVHHNFCPNCGADMRGEQDG